MNKNYLIIGLIILALIVIGVIAARSSDETILNNNGDGEETTLVSTIEVSDQTVAENSIVVDSVYMETNGWIILRRTTDEGELDPTSVIGMAALTAGASQGVVIPLMEAVENGEVLVAMLHHDTGVAGEYEFGAETPNIDEPVVVNGDVVAAIFTVSIGDTTSETTTEIEVDVEGTTE